MLSHLPDSIHLTSGELPPEILDEQAARDDGPLGIGNGFGHLALVQALVSRQGTARASPDQIARVRGHKQQRDMRVSLGDPQTTVVENTLATIDDKRHQNGVCLVHMRTETQKPRTPRRTVAQRLLIKRGYRFAIAAVTSLMSPGRKPSVEQCFFTRPI